MSQQKSHEDNKEKTTDNTALTATSPARRATLRGLIMADHVESQEEEKAYHWAREFEFGDAHWSTHQFIEQALSRGPKEIGCAFAASFLVSPLVSIIDKCIVKDISSTSQFLGAIANATKEIVFTPKTFFNSLSFRLTFAVYFGTYAVANLAELAMDANGIRDDGSRKTDKVTAASVANISLLMWRDAVFAREFGNSSRPSAPLRTLGLFALRDSATMFSTFYVAPRAADVLHNNYGVERNIAELSTALAIPMVTQVITAPAHIHAMDYYNKPKASMAERFAVIKSEFSTVSFARGLRILPAFGIGSFSNNKFRELFIRQENEDKLLQRRLTRFMTRLGADNRRLVEEDNKAAAEGDTNRMA